MTRIISQPSQISCINLRHKMCSKVAPFSSEMTKMCSKVALGSYCRNLPFLAMSICLLIHQLIQPPHDNTIILDDPLAFFTFDES